MVGSPTFHPRLLKNLPAADVLRVKIQSTGGHYRFADEIIKILRAFPGEVHIDVVCAGSAAAIVAAVGDRRRIHSDGWFTLHGMWGVAFGTIAQIRATADQFRECEEEQIAIFEHAGVPRETVEELLATERPLSAQEAVELGFCHSVIDAPGYAPRFPSLDAAELCQRRFDAIVRADYAAAEQAVSRGLLQRALDYIKRSGTRLTGVPGQPWECSRCQRENFGPVRAKGCVYCQPLSRDG